MAAKATLAKRKAVEAYADQAIAKMRSPREMHIICVDVTNKCDLHCSNCTRLLKNQTTLWDMTPDNFRRALKSLADYRGIIAMLGGNPCLHKNFPELCKIFAEEVPNKRQRGLWTNNVFGYQELIIETFGMFNLNPHGDERGRKSIEVLKKMLPPLNYFVGHSHHAPLLTAMRDLYPDPKEMWEIIPSCDINRQWSASIVQNQGELRVYFCEVAASFDLARGEDHGMPLTDGWWNKSVADYSEQVKHFCPGCGAPARLKGALDIQQVDTYTPSNRDIVENSLKKRRKVVEIQTLQDVERLHNPVTNYNAHHEIKDHGVVESDGVVAHVFAKNNRYHCLPAGGGRDTAQSVARLDKVRLLPPYVPNLIGADETVLYIGPGFATDIIDIAAKARQVNVLEPSTAAVECLILASRLNDRPNIKIQRLAAYDHNAVAEFAVTKDPFDGLADVENSSDVSDEAIEHVNCVRVDDYFDIGSINAMILSTFGNGDIAAVMGAEKTLAQARMLAMDFNHEYYAKHPERLAKLVQILDGAFAHCYAPHLKVKNAGAGFTDLFSHMLAAQSSGCLLLSKAEII